jgi:hypothetical protein
LDVGLAFHADFRDQGLQERFLVVAVAVLEGLADVGGQCNDVGGCQGFRGGVGDGGREFGVAALEATEPLG